MLHEPQLSNEPFHTSAEPAPLPKGYTLPSSRKGLTINLQDVVGRTRLHQAVIDESEVGVKELLSAGAAVNIKDLEGNEPLHYAAAGASEDIVQLLIDFGAPVDARGNSGRTPLHMSLQAPKHVEILLKARALTSIQDDRGDTPLHLALSAETLSSYADPKTAACLLLVHGADVNILNAAGVTPFHLVLDRPQSDNSQSTSWMRGFLNSGANIFLQTRDGQLPFSVYLNQSNYDWTRYKYRGFDEDDNFVLKKFLAKGADPNTRLKSGETLLHQTLKQGIANENRDWRLGMLLCQTADVSNPGLSGNYPLHEVLKTSVRYGLKHIPDFIRILVSRLADPDQMSRDGFTPLTLLLSKGNDRFQTVEITRALFKAGADPLRKSQSGEFPLHLAIRGCTKAIRRELAEVILATALEYDPTKRAASESGELSKDLQWWYDWVTISKARDWTTTKKRYFCLESVLDKDIRDVAAKIAMKLTVQRCLDAIKADYEDLKAQTGASNPQSQAKQSQIVGILRDCRNIGIEIEGKWFEYLLNFFD